MLQHLRQTGAQAADVGTAVVASTAAGGGHGCDGQPAGSSKDGRDLLLMKWQQQQQQQWQHVLSMGVGTSAGISTALTAGKLEPLAQAVAGWVW
jgi:hypothetical protein